MRKIKQNYLTKEFKIKLFFLFVIAGLTGLVMGLFFGIEQCGEVLIKYAKSLGIEEEIMREVLKRYGLTLGGRIG